jgi:hypothetical protein
MALAVVFESVTYLSRPGIFTASWCRIWQGRRSPQGGPVALSVVDPAELRLAV